MSYRSSPSFADGGILYDPDGLTNDVPAYGWRCFHCGEHFMPKEWLKARQHFGARTVEPPICQRALEAGRRVIEWYDSMKRFHSDPRERPPEIDRAMRLFRNSARQ
jgi:hypothetical protein